MCSVYKRVGAIFCTIGVILMFVAGLAFNSVSAVDASGSTLELLCQQEGAGLEGMKWQIYRIGENRNGQYSFTGDFVTYKDTVDLSKIAEDSERMTEASSTLSSLALIDGILPEAVGKTDGNGRVEFNGLSDALYLVVGAKLKIGNYTYFPTPFLIYSDGRGSSVMKVEPKFTPKKTLPGSTERFLLQKVWGNSEGIEDKPKSLVIEIYEDYELYDTVRLTEEDGWSYSWVGSPESDWRVKEVSIPAGCYVIYRNTEVQYVIVNSYDNDLLIAAKTSTTTTATTTTATQLNVSTEVSTTVNTTEDGTDGSKSKETSTSTTAATTEDGTSASKSKETTTTVTTVVSTIGGGDSSKSASKTTTVGTVKPGESSKTTTTTVSVSSTTVSVSSTTVSVSSLTTSYYTDDSGSTIYVTETTTTVSSSTSTTSSEYSYFTTTRRTYSSGNNIQYTTTSASKLPQTGQLWWPVPVMALGGLVFVAVGFKLILDSKKEED